MSASDMSEPKVTRVVNDLAYRHHIDLVICYIQEHLDEPLDLEKLSKVAGYSPYHTHRLFAAFVGETIGEYLRRLRLGRSVQQLLTTDTAITTIALQCGYQTPAAFSKAFRKHYRTTPSQVRQAGLPIEHLIRPSGLSRQNRRRGKMKPEILSLPKRNVLTVLRKGLIDNNFNQAADQAFCVLEDFIEKHHLWNQTQDCLGITPDDPSLTPPEENRYYAGYFLQPGAQVKTEGEVKIMTFPAGRFAKFIHRGPYETMWQTWTTAYRDWLPASGEKLREVMPYEVYVNDKHKVPPEELVTEIYVPIE